VAGLRVLCGLKETGYCTPRSTRRAVCTESESKPSRQHDVGPTEAEACRSDGIISLKRWDLHGGWAIHSVQGLSKWRIPETTMQRGCILMIKYLSVKVVGEWSRMAYHRYRA
jgi:hypothetical protein